VETAALFDKAQQIVKSLARAHAAITRNATPRTSLFDRVRPSPKTGHRWIELPEDHFFTGLAIGLAIAVIVWFARFPG
jgi:hypothetical protein